MFPIPPPSAPAPPAPNAPAPNLSASVDSAAPSADPVVQVLPTLMSLVTTPPQPSNRPVDMHEDPAPSQASLFSSEASIGSFSYDEMTPPLSLPLPPLMTVRASFIM